MIQARLYDFAVGRIHQDRLHRVDIVLVAEVFAAKFATHVNIFVSGKCNV